MVDAGERGVAVYSAHRDTHFLLPERRRVWRRDRCHQKRRQEIPLSRGLTSIVRFDASGIDPLTDGYELVLSTCWPFDALTPGPDRYLLHATVIAP
jgi:sortase A